MIQAFSTEEMQARVREQRDILRGSYPAITKDEVSTIDFGFGRQVPEEGHRYLMWLELAHDKYYRALQHMQSLVSMGKPPMVQEELGRMAETLVNQAMAGRAIASSVPLYYDVWTDLKGDKSPVRDFVTKDHETKAVNEGFWYSLASTADPRKVRDAATQLMNILDHKKFMDLFSFEKGLDKIEGLPLELDFTNMGHPLAYLHWYTIMGSQLLREKGDKVTREQRGKLFGPLYPLFFGEESLGEEQKELVALANVYARDLLDTQGIQRGARIIFEHALSSALSSYPLGGEETAIKHTSRVLADHIEVGRKVVAGLAGVKEAHEVPAIYRVYFARDAVKKQIKDLADRVMESETLDTRLLRKWLDVEAGEDLTKSRKSFVTNRMLAQYFGQRPRPKVEEVECLDRMLGNIQNKAGIKVRSFALADLLRKKRWKQANGILIPFFADWNVASKMREPLGEYVETHGKIRITADGLRPEECEPQFNYVPRFAEREKGLVELV